MRKRLYRHAGVEQRGETFLVVLDGKAARSPRGVPLGVPAQALAEAIANEWNRQGEWLNPADMGLTALANSAIDRATSHRGEVIGHILGFGRSDLVCYRAGEAELAARQSAVWDSLLAWAQTEHGIRLATDRGIAFIEQPADALLRMQEIVARVDDFLLVAFDGATALTGSFVLALALVEGRIDAAEAFAASQVDELYQAQKWGRDAEAEVRRGHMLKELKAIEQFIRLLRDMH